VFQAQGQLDDALLEYEAAKQIMRRLTQRYPGNADWQRDLGFAYNRVGSVWEGRGELNQAVPEYEQSLTIAKKLVMLDPTNRLWQQDLIDIKLQIEHARR
jgi:tetratricopeptide (TPR) repeat protein